MGNLTELFEQLKTEIEKQLGCRVYSHPIGNGGRALTATESRKGNFGNVWTRIRSDKLFPNCPLPHLQVAINNEWAANAGVIPEKIKKEAWHDKDHDAAFWCLPGSDDRKLREVAKYLTKVCVYISSKS